MPARFKSDSLTLQKHASAPSAPATNEVALYVKSDGKLYSRDSGNVEAPVGGAAAMSLPLPTLRNFWMVRAGAGLAEGVGIANPVPTGTASISNQSDSTYVNYNTGAAAGLLTGFATTLNLVRRQYNPTLEMIVRTGDPSSLRLWLGLANGAMPNAEALGAVSGCVFRYSPSVDSGWVGVCSNGTGQTVSSVVGPVAINSRYLLRLRLDNALSTAYFSVNNGTEVAMTANLPSDITELGLHVRVINTIAAARDLRFSRAVCLFD